MNFFIQYEWLMYLAFALCMFFIAYRWLPVVLNILYMKTMNSQKEVLRIIEMMRIQKDQKRIIISLWVFCLCMGLLPIFALLPRFLIGSLIGLVFFVFSWEGLKWTMKAIWESYCFKVDSQLGEGLALMANGLKVGLSVTQAMEKVALRMKGPLGSEFTLVLNKIQLGMGLEESLEEMIKRVNTPDIMMFVTSVNILKETGGNLAETFSVISNTIRERQKLNGKIKALTSQAMMQAKIVSFIPFVLIGIMYFLNRSYIEILFTTVLGWVCLAIITFLVLFGGKIMRKMAKIDI